MAAVVDKSKVFKIAVSKYGDATFCFWEWSCPRSAPALSPLRFTPLHPAHPGRLQDDGARQVSWLPGRRFLSAFPVSQWHLDKKLAGYSCGGSQGFNLVPYTLHLMGLSPLRPVPSMERPPCAWNAITGRTGKAS
jgi:hypothetical protein